MLQNKGVVILGETNQDLLSNKEKVDNFSIAEFSKIQDVGLAVETFLSLTNSKSTESNYRVWLKEFFEYAYNKHYSKVYVDEIELLTNQTIELYRVHLLNDKGNSPNSVNSKVSALIKLINYLYKNDFKVDPLKLKPMKTLKTNIDSYEAFTYEEIQDLIETAKTYRNGNQKSLLIELAFKTGIRKDALLKINRDNFKLTETGWVLEVLDKGMKKDIKPLTYEFYNDKILPELNQREDGEKLFQMTDRTVTNLLMKLKEDLCIKGNKTFHSIKKSFVNRVAEISDRDVALMQLAGNHDDVSTTLKYYYKDTTLSDKLRMTVHMLDGIDTNIFDDVDYKVLLEAVKNCGINVHLELSQKITEIQNKSQY